MHGKLSQLPEVDVAFFHNSTFFVITFLNCHVDAQLQNLGFDLELLDERFCEQAHHVVNHDFLLAARAVEVVKGNP